MNLDDDDEYLQPVRPAATKKRKREAEDSEEQQQQQRTEAPAQVAVLSAFELQRVIDDKVKAKIVSAFSVLGRVDRFESSGAGYVMRVNKLASSGVRQEAVQRAIQDSGIHAVHVLVRPSTPQGAELQITFTLKPGARGAASVVHRQFCLFGDGALKGVGVSTRSDTHRLLAESLVPAKEDRAMIARIISNWENYRAQDTPVDVAWQLLCLDGTTIDSKTGESKKNVGGATAATAAEAKQSGATAAAATAYKLRIYGIRDATLAEMAAMSQPFMFHCSSAKVDPALGCFSHDIATYVSGGSQAAFVMPIVGMERV